MHGFNSTNEWMKSYPRALPKISTSVGRNLKSAAQNILNLSFAGEMPNDKGGYRPLMAASSQLDHQGGEPLV